MIYLKRYVDVWAKDKVTETVINEYVTENCMYMYSICTLIIFVRKTAWFISDTYLDDLTED